MALKRNLFISYAHKDMTPIHWLDRLRVYLAPLRTGDLEVWDDSNIVPGSKWREDIEGALDRADIAIFLVGPHFFASRFITEVELPRLLVAAQTNGLKIFPVVIAYCMYTEGVLGEFQSFNNPAAPMESLLLADQNKLLNSLSIAIDEVLRHSSPSKSDSGTIPAQKPQLLLDAVNTIRRHLANTRKAFVAQCNRRDDLVASITGRLGIKNDFEYEKFFIRFYPKLTRPERFEFDQMRALTEGPLAEGNKAILEILQNCPTLLDQLPILVNLQQHLVFWLNKYERVFLKTPGMCLLYTGVEDGVPFPVGLDKAFSSWASKIRPQAATSLTGV